MPKITTAAEIFAKAIAYYPRFKRGGVFMGKQAVGMAEVGQQNGGPQLYEEAEASLLKNYPKHYAY